MFSVRVGLSSVVVRRAVLTAIVVAGLTYLWGGPALRTLLPLASDIVALTAILVSLHRYRGTHRRVWTAIAPGVALLSIVHFHWFLRVGLGGAATADNAWTGVIQAIAWACMITGCLAALRRRAAGASGGVVEAALIGMGLTTPLWEFLLRPALLALHTPVAAQVVILIPVFCITAIMGGLFKLVPEAGAARNTLRYMFVALGCSLIGVTTLITRTDPVTGGQPAWIVLFWVAAMVSLAGAALDPANDHLGEVSPSTGGTTVRLRYVGAGLLLGPAVGAVPPVLFGQEPDVVLLCAGQAAMTVLVLVRLSQLERSRAAQRRLLVEQAQHDELTGLPNRRHLFSLLQEFSGRGTPVAVLFCDLNDFKPINDRLGHEAGDDVLKAVAAGCVPRSVPMTWWAGSAVTSSWSSVPAPRSVRPRACVTVSCRPCVSRSGGPAISLWWASRSGSLWPAAASPGISWSPARTS